MDDLRNWTTVGVTDHPSGATDVNRTNLNMVPAILRRRPRGGMSVMISWQTSDELFGVRPDGGDMTYQDGDRILVLISTVTSSRRGCHNGHAHIDALQTSPGEWCRNVF